MIQYVWFDKWYKVVKDDRQVYSTSELNIDAVLSYETNATIFNQKLS